MLYSVMEGACSGAGAGATPFAHGVTLVVTGTGLSTRQITVRFKPPAQGDQGEHHRHRGQHERENQAAPARGSVLRAGPPPL